MGEDNQPIIIKVTKKHAAAGTPITGEQTARPTNDLTNESKPNSRLTTVVANHDHHQTQEQLPQTGNTKPVLLGALAGFLGAFGLLGLRKRRN